MENKRFSELSKAEQLAVSIMMADNPFNNEPVMEGLKAVNPKIHADNKMNSKSIEKIKDIESYFSAKQN